MQTNRLLLRSWSKSCSAMFSSVTPSTREPVDLYPGFLDRPAKFLAPTETGCTTESYCNYNKAAFDMAVREMKPDGDGGGPALQVDASEAGGAAG